MGILATVSESSTDHDSVFEFEQEDLPPKLELRLPDNTHLDPTLTWKKRQSMVVATASDDDVDVGYKFVFLCCFISL